MNRKEQAIALWRICFDDDEAFIRLFFSRLYTDARLLSLEQDGQIASSLHMLPYKLIYYGISLPVCYIYGVCTSPLYRSRGLMKSLLDKAEETMRSRGAVLSMLIPSEPGLFDYYQRCGYVPAFGYAHLTYTAAASSLVLPPPQGIRVAPSGNMPTELLYAYFDSRLRARTCCLLHTQEDFEVILASLSISGGQLLVARTESGKIAGMAFVDRTKKDAYIPELLADDEPTQLLLLQEATAMLKVEQLTYRLPPSSAATTSTPLGMAHILDLQRLLAAYNDSHPEQPLTQREAEGMTPDALTRRLLIESGQEAYMSLMLD